MGAVLRDTARQFIAATSSWSTTSMTAAEADASSLLEGLEWITSYNHQHVNIELDCQQGK
ncbi:hypothetical protein TSUD_186710 [Trifolium subterraneum]|uniref:RNase H type-1 domain-containing protein n=1 Tax=Trifolium subterraneum TaxID=3900 RepID=A0A2Z6NM77_TRISU|nr:hypothetical protein TSUD_186710 [Trifolium subterraneum]